ncbi:WG repeat-containing protein [Tissierella pigra]|uniref:WG repeat-containing protein n=1 Tax=Tissierella pigra TaxID=2607614 RepID=A0A6N7XK07_9FIRM|nr:WG repeat-containing protein [Tissierella pigra]MBU5427004.1 WG repeat-containing protein [Tissierella pigra]MSU02399.1 WG repeat-containing protein [Tissierella pigra]
MKKVGIIALSLLILFNLVGCVNKGNEEVVKLYPAFKTEKNTKTWGYINKSGKFIIEPQYQRVLDFSKNGVAEVYKNGGVGLINSKGEEIIAPQYQQIIDLDGGYFLGYDGELIYIFDSKGKEYFSGEYIYVGSYSDDLFGVGKITDGGEVLMGYVNKSGMEIIEPAYSRVYDFHNGKALVLEGKDKYKIIDKKGNIIKELEYPLVVPSVDDNIYLVKDENGLFGYIDNEDNTLIEPKFNKGNIFENGNAVVAVGEDDNYLYGLIDREGKYLLEPEYRNIVGFGNGYYGVEKEMDGKEIKYAISNNKGELLTDFTYSNLNNINIKNNFISVFDGKETYILNFNGDKVELPVLKGKGELSFDGNVLRKVSLNKLSYYNSKGEIIWEENSDYVLSEDVNLKEKTYVEEGINIRYPYVEGMKNKEVEEKINKELYNRFMNNEGHAFYEVTYDVNRINDLLTISKYYQYSDNGETEVVGNGEVYNISLQNGKFFNLGDLFKDDSDYKKIVSENIAGKLVNSIMDGSTIYGIENFTGVDEEQSFIPTMDQLNIVFKSANPLTDIETISIPQKDIEDVLDMGKEFWWALMVSKGF